MFNFLLTQDLVESSLLKANGLINMDEVLQNRLLKESNEWYLEEAEELGVDESDIMVYNPNIDASDERNRTMIKLVMSHYLVNAFYAEWGKKDDIYELKLPKAQKDFDILIVKMTPNRVMGISPAVIKSPSAVTSFTRRRSS